MKSFTLIILLIWLPLLSDGLDAQNAEAPYITTQLEQLDGSQISLRFKAWIWDEAIMAAIQQIPEQQDYFNENVLSKWGVLTTNVKLHLGPYPIDPGSYTTGFLYKKPDPATIAAATGTVPSNWQFVLADKSKKLIQFPIPMTTTNNTVPYLSYVLSPGITTRDFVLTFLFGPYTTNLKWTITGIPALSIKDSAIQPNSSFIPSQVRGNSELNDLATVSSVTKEVNILPERSNSLIHEATPTQSFQGKKPPGLGAFRRLFKSAEELRGQLNQ